MKIFFAVALFFVPVLAGAHSRLKASNTIQIRSTNPGIKSGPCGGLARSLTPATLTPGQNVVIEFEETIFHPGRFEIYFSPAGEANFTLLKTIPQNPANNSGNVPHQFLTSVTLPNVTCTDCTLQLIQVMLENPAVPSLYYSCADLQLKAAGTPSTTPTPVASPTPVCATP
ncbi:MAG: lytic polysaccharide monooxygenase [Bdellovibrionaceae bacterium]|nr:lytic polysaccharide monooxygenase [Pseudobdellovibrionaceae bacterium]